jgi:hypothetical protein
LSSHREDAHMTSLDHQPHDWHQGDTLFDPAVVLT